MFAMMTAVLLASSPVSLQFDGPLKDGLKQLAEKSGLNLVVIGEFDEKVQLNLPNVDGPEALETIALAYGLEVTRKGAASNLWVVRKAGGAIPKAPPVLAVAPVPPVPPVAVATPNVNSDALRSAAETAREEAEQAREEAERIREKLESLRGASAEAREKVQEALEQAREKAQEAAEEAREKAEEAREAARDQAEALRESAQAQAELSREKARLVREQMALQRHKVSTGGPITIEKGTRVEAAVAYGGPVIVEEGAVVDGDAVAFGGDVVLKAGAVVEGDAVSFGGTVVRDDTAVVRGDAVSLGGANFGAQVARNVVRKERAERAGAKDAADEADSPSSNGGRGFAAFLLQFAVFFGLGFLLMMFAPNRMKALEATIRAEPAKNGLAGFLGLLATVPITAALVVTLVGIPVALMLWILVALFIPAGLAVVANAVGAKLPTGRMRKTQALVLAVGLLALLLVGHIPVLGPMVLAVAVFVSMGAIIRTRFGQTGKGLPMLDPLQQTAPMV